MPTKSWITTTKHLILSAIMVGITCAPTAHAGRSDWRELTVGRFHVYSTLRDSRTREIARQLQVFSKTVGELIQGPDAIPDIPTLVYLIDGGDFNRYAAFRPGLGGFFSERSFANVIVVNGDMDFDFTKVSILHEYTHYIHRSTHTLVYPPWYTEGYAELMSSASLKGNVVTIGGAPDGVRINLAQWMPVERILAVKASDPEYITERLAPQFYGEAWALVHYLLFDSPDLKAPTARYLGNLDVGLQEPEAYERSFPFDKQHLDVAVRKLIEHGIIRIKRITYPDPITADDAPIRSMTVAEADAAFTRMIFLVNPKHKSLDDLAANVLKENPSDLAVRALFVRIAAHRAEHLEIGDLLSALMATDAGGASPIIDVADALLNAEQTTDEQVRQIAALLQSIAEAESPPIEAVALWAKAELRLKGDLGPAIPTLEAASKRVPHNTQLLADLAAANWSAGQKDKARAYYNQIISVSHNPAERVWAQKQADSPALQ